MNDVVEHLRAPIPEGGHGLGRYLVRWPEDRHAQEHDPRAWWHQLLTHTHEDDPADQKDR